MRYVNAYVNFLKKNADIRRPLKVVLDCSNGPVSLILKKLKIPNLKIILINSRIDGRFPAHAPNPLEAGATDDLKRAVKKHRADLGAVFDSDADRVFFVDNLGRQIPFHAITHLMSRESKPPYVGDIYVAETLKHLELLKIRSSKVGTYNVKRAMKKIGASLGAEFSGHYFFKEMKDSDSGILALIKTLNAISKTPYTIAQFIELSPEFYYEQFNKKIKNPATVMKKIYGTYRKRALKTSRLDGYLFEFENWLLAVRSSNTEPLLRFFVGSRNKKIFKEKIKKIKSFA